MKLIDKIRNAKIYGIIRDDDPKHAYEIAKAYYEGGIRVIELNAPIEATKEVCKLERGSLIDKFH